MKKFIKYLSLFTVLFTPSITFADDLEITPVDICSSNSGTLKSFSSDWIHTLHYQNISSRYYNSFRFYRIWKSSNFKR